MTYIADPDAEGDELGPVPPPNCSDCGDLGGPDCQACDGQGRDCRDCYGLGTDPCRSCGA